MAQLRLMFSLLESDGQMLSDLAAEMHVTPPTITGLTDRLVKRDLARAEAGPERPPGDPRLADTGRRSGAPRVRDPGRRVLHSRLRGAGRGADKGPAGQPSRAPRGCRQGSRRHGSRVTRWLRRPTRTTPSSSAGTHTVLSDRRARWGSLGRAIARSCPVTCPALPIESNVPPAAAHRARVPQVPVPHVPAPVQRANRHALRSRPGKWCKSVPSSASLRSRLVAAPSRWS